MRPKLLALALVAACFALAGCDIEEFGSFDRQSRDFHYSYPMRAGARLTLENFNGSVEITGWDQDTVDISGAKYAPTEGILDALQIEIRNNPDSVEIRTVRPSSIRGGAGARYVIKAPRKALLERIVTSNGAVRVADIEGPARLKTSNGSVRAQGLKGDLDAQTSNGSIELTNVEGGAVLRTSNAGIRADELRGSLDATTSNGSIRIGMERLDAGRRVSLLTSNGGVELTLPSNLAGDVKATTSNGGITVHLPNLPGARVTANTSNGSVTSEFEVKSMGASSKNRLEGSIGAGGPYIDLNTSNAAIRLLKLKM